MFCEVQTAPSKTWNNQPHPTKITNLNNNLTAITLAAPTVMLTHLYKQTPVGKAAGLGAHTCFVYSGVKIL